MLKVVLFSGLCDLTQSNVPFPPLSLTYKLRHEKLIVPVYYWLHLRYIFFFFLRMSGVSARCIQATVSFLRLCITTHFCSIMEVACFISMTTYTSEKVRAGSAGKGRTVRLFGEMKITPSRARRMDKPGHRRSRMKIIILKLKLEPRGTSQRMS